MNFFRRKYIGACFIVLLGLFAASASASESDVVRALLSTISNWPSDWNPDAISPSNYCDWTGIDCNVDMSITEIRWGTTVFIRGYIPDEIGQLVNLTVFGGPSVGLYGTIPASFWALPKLRNVALTRGGLTGTFPPVITPSLQRVNLWKNRFNGTIPASFINPNMALLKLSSNRLRCPLPESLLQRLDDPNFTIDLENNEFEMVGGKICNQIDVRQHLTRILPVAERIPKFPITPSYEFGHGRNMVYLKDRFILISNKNPATGAFWQSNYAVIDFQGIQLMKREPTSELSRPLAMATALPFALPLQSSADGHSVNVTQVLTDGGRVIWKFIFDESSVRVGFEITGIAAYSPTITDANARHQILLSHHIKSPHSGAEPLECATDANFMAGNTGICLSEPYNFALSTRGVDSVSDYDGPADSITMSLPLSYSIDNGVIDSFEILDLSTRLYPFGELESVTSAVQAGDFLGTYNPDYQFISNLFQVATHPFRSSFNYNFITTTVEIKSLYNSTTGPVGPAPSQSESKGGSGVPTSTIAGIVAGILAFIAAVILLIVFIPKIREKLGKQQQIDTETGYSPLMADA